MENKEKAVLIMPMWNVLTNHLREQTWNWGKKNHIGQSQKGN